MKLVSFRFSVLNLNRKTHHNCTAEGNGFVHMFNRTKFNITDSVSESQERLNLVEYDFGLPF